MDDVMKARCEAAEALLAFGGKMIRAATTMLHAAARLQVETASTGRATGPVRKGISASRPSWGDEVLAIIDKLEAVDPGGTGRAAVREGLRDEKDRVRVAREAEADGRLVPFHSFDRLRRDRDQQDGGPPPGAA